MPRLLIAALLLLGAGCASPQPDAVATRDMFPESFVIMDGMEPLRESEWRIIGTGAVPRIDSTWQTEARFDEVIAFYQDAYQAGGLATHRVENDDGVRLYWGLHDRIRNARPETHDFIYAAARPVDQKTVVRIVITQKPK